MGRRRPRMVLALVVVLAGAACTRAQLSTADRPRGSPDAAAVIASVFPDGVESLDGSGNNLDHPEWGRANRPYSRLAPANYADGIAEMVDGPSPRMVSNRIFNDLGQNVFSENGVTPWAGIWGQFLDHNFGLAESGGVSSPIPFDRNDPLEGFTDDLGVIDFARNRAAPGTGRTSPRQQVNTVSSYLDGWAIYGGTPQRLEWLREGPLDGDLSNNGPHLLETSDGYLPRADAREAPAPEMQLMGQLQALPQRAVEAGDVRANENIGLTAVHTLFVREHNRIVDALPADLPAEAKFQIARRVVTAEIQYVTYTEFLPAMGVRLPRYSGYRPNVDATLSNEFATVGYRGHSMIHGTIDPRVNAGELSKEQLDSLAALGVDVAADGEQVELEIPLNLAYGNPDLLEAVGLDPVLRGLAAEREYRNDEMIDDQLRSVLFQIPGPDVADPSDCLDGPAIAGCFRGVLDLGAVDIERGRDHGMPSYNDLRAAYGLKPEPSFAAITGEPTEVYRGRESDWIDDPSILRFTKLMDADGRRVRPGTQAAEEDVVSVERRTTLAARLKAIYGGVDRLDAFVGMLAEPHVRGSEFGPLELAMWTRQFQALRDGDRFFYLNDPSLPLIEQRYGITYRHTLAEIIAMNTGVDDAQDDVFVVAPESDSGSG